MPLAPHRIDHIEQHIKLHGHPGDPIKPHIYAEAERRGEPLRRQSVGTHTPPLPGADAGPGGCCDGLPSGQRGHCHVCGAHTGLDEGLAAHAVAGFEDVLDKNGPVRFLVTHCAAHKRGAHDACRRDRETPGSGLVGVAGGYCEPLDKVIEMNVVFLPGARHLARFMKAALTISGLYLLSQLAVSISQGQQTADNAGPVTSLLYPGDSTSGHGMNVGLLRVLSGSAPSTAPAGNQAETGTLGISWTMPNPAFASNSLSGAAMVLTAGTISNVNASATITAGYARLIEAADSGFGLSTTLRRLQFAVGTSGSDLNLNTLSITSGGACSCTALLITTGTAA